MSLLFSISSIFGAAILIAASVVSAPAALKEKGIFIPAPPNLEYLSFGFQMPLADSLWIRALQDFDYCENKLEQNLCVGNGWLAQMLDAITNLAPDYQIVYRTGGLALTVLVSDYEGASKIFDKGVRLFPKDKNLLYRAAYHAMLEEKNPEKAAGLLIQAAKIGGNVWFYSLATKLYSEAGKKEMGEKLYQELKNEPGVNEATLKRMRLRLDGAL